MELTEKYLVSMCGWPVFKQAKAILGAGRVSAASYEPPVLKGRVAGDAKEFLCGLRIASPTDVENLCPCKDSRVRGIICAHSVAVGLAAISPAATRGHATREAAAPEPQPAPPVPTKSGSAPDRREPTAEAPRVSLRLEGSLRHVDAEIDFIYSRPGIANALVEQAALTKMVDSGFTEFRGRPALVGEDAVLRFFAGPLRRLKAEWDVEEGERFRNVTRDLVRIEPRFAIREAPGGYFDVHLHYAAGTDALLTHADLLRLLQGGTPKTPLKSGKVAVADPAAAAELTEVLRDCDPEQGRGGFRIRAEYRPYLEAALGEIAGLPDAPETPRASAAELGPVGAILRPYQVEGALWMLDRARSGAGGLLADEMGLGKTVQTLAMVRALDGPVLVVCPASLTWNWCRETARFLPGREVVSVEGTARAEKIARLAGPVLAVTSYGSLRRDVALYDGIEFSAVVLDEAQHIKNPDSQNAKAACALRARSRFVLTGTPVENSVRDLWSLFEFILPGYLGARDDFRERYESPILSGQSGDAFRRLARRIRPWMLRRRKAEILTELPAKIEQVLEIELTEPQRRAYTELQRVARERVEDLSRSANPGAARMRALTALLRLRQACCDLRLLGAPGADDAASAKLGALLELLEEASDAGHRVLVFSQFTSMLDLIEPALADAGIPSVRLDGSTRDREGAVRRFQEGADLPVFLISLKAGGTGLNLTAADTVIHFDPWWNPAVEAQATDRAHRIGQRSVVTQIKLIARGTIEERVLELQRRKRDVIESAVDGDTALGALDPGDLAELVAD